MKKLLFGIMTITGFQMVWEEVSAQSIYADFTLSAASGYVSNPYLIPMIPDWDRSRISAYSSLSPSGQLRYTGSNFSVTVNGTGNFLHYFDERPVWLGGYLTSMYRHRISSSVSFKAVGGLNGYSTNYDRNMQWLQPGIEWLITPFTRMEAFVGTSWRTIKGLDESDDIRDRYDFYGLTMEYWPGYRWRLRGNFFSSLSHITSPADGFSSTFSVSHIRYNGTVLMLRTGLEQYSVDLQGSLSDGLVASATGDFSFSASVNLMDDIGETFTLEDRFYRTMLQVSHPVYHNITLSGTLSGLLWVSNEDDNIESDFQISAGVNIPISGRMSRSGELREIRWESKEPRNALLTVRYRAEEPLYITGDFNDWENPGIPLRRTGRNRFSVQLDLPVGMHEYKIGKRKNDELEWLELPDEAATVSDGFGGRNGSIFIDY